MEMRFVPSTNEVELGRPSRGGGADEANGLGEWSPVLTRGGRRLEIAERRQRISRVADPLQHFGRSRRSHSGQQLNDTEAGHAVARILRPTQKGKHILDMRGFEKLESAEFHERNVTAGQLDFERSAMVRGAK